MSSTILLADDSLTIQKVVELTFADTDYQVVAVSSGDALLQKLPECQPDLVICDVIMPGRDGYEVCQEIKSNPESLHLPVILLTGTFEPFDRDRALAAGCSEIITKPFEARKLVEAVERLASETATAAPPEAAGIAHVEHEGQITPPPSIPVSEAAAAAESEEFGTQLSQVAPPPEIVEEAAPQPPIEETAQVSPPEDSQPEEPPVVETEPDSGPAPVEELDFTSTGFAEMEAAGREQQVIPSDPPAEGLDFEIGGPPDESAPAEYDEIPKPESDDSPAVEASEAEAHVAEAEPVEPVEAPAFEAPAIEAPEAETPETEVSAAVTPPAETEQEDTDVDTHPFPEPLAPEDSSPGDSPAIPDQEVEEPFAEPPEPPPPSEPMDVEEDQPFVSEVLPPEVIPPPDIEDYGQDLSEPIDEGIESNLEEATEMVTPEVEEEPPAISDHVTDRVDTPQVLEASPQPTASGAVSLSEEDIDRIARRMLELASDRIEHIAWEVIPDMAEIVVRERVRKIEEEAESHPTDTL